MAPGQFVFPVVLSGFQQGIKEAQARCLQPIIEALELSGNFETDSTCKKMTHLLRAPITSRRSSDVLTEALRAFADKRKKKAVRFGMDIVLKQIVIEGDLKELMQLVEKHGNSLVNQRDSFSMPIVVTAVIEDQYEVLEFLVSKGADLRLSDDEGWTALHAAAACGDLRAAKCIVKAAGPGVTNLRTVHGLRPIDLAESTEVAHFLLTADLNAFKAELFKIAQTQTNQPSDQAVCATCTTKEEGAVVSAIMSRSYKDALRYIRERQQMLGHSLLHVAAAKNFPKLALVLLERKLAGVSSRDESGWTPLHTASYHNSLDVALLLRDYGADIDAREDDGLTPLYLTEDHVIREILTEVML